MSLLVCCEKSNTAVPITQNMKPSIGISVILNGVSNLKLGNTDLPRISHNHLVRPLMVSEHGCSSTSGLSGCAFFFSHD